jgi:hypothetical protein
MNIMAEPVKTSINDTFTQRMTVAYYGPVPAASINPTIITIIQQLVAALLGGCTPPAAKARVTNEPRRARLRMLYEAYQMTGDLTEANHMADATLAVAQQSSVEDYAAFQAANPA